MGTAGGFMQAVTSQVTRADIWLVLNGDSLVFADFARFVQAFALGTWDAAVMGLRVADAARFGSLEIGPGGELQRFAEKRPGAGLINAGVYLFRQPAIRKFPDRVPLSFETDVFPTLIAAGARVLVHAVEAPFLDIGTPESLAQAESFIMDNCEPRVLRPARALAE